MEAEEWPMQDFTVTNPPGPGQGDVAQLLRRVLSRLESLDAEIYDIVFHSYPTADEDALRATVYYRPHEGAREHHSTPALRLA